MLARGGTCSSLRPYVRTDTQTQVISTELLRCVLHVTHPEAD